MGIGEEYIKYLTFGTLLNNLKRPRNAFQEKKMHEVISSKKSYL